MGDGWSWAGHLYNEEESVSDQTSNTYKFILRIGSGHLHTNGGEVLSDQRDSPVDGLLKKWLPQIVNLFRTKARDYETRDGMFTADHLGAAGQYAEIWRKIPKLKRAMWDGDPLAGETVQEVLMDLIGHCLLALDYLGEVDIPPGGEKSDPNLLVNPSFGGSDDYYTASETGV